MTTEFWNERYREEGFAYGNEPNDFLKEHEFKKGSKVLCLAEGEGRNAIYLARLGCAVKTVDSSIEGIRKTLELAESNGLEVEAVCQDLRNYEFEQNEWDAIVIIFGHFPPELRREVHSKLYNALTWGGRVILEAYSKEQLPLKTGGPSQIDLLYSDTELRQDFADFEELEIKEIRRNIQEGKYHNGISAVVQVSARKKKE
jgi:SAM-dependent methyltransferase